MISGSSCLIIFVKNPELGKVKTRLAKSIGDEEALKVYKKLLNHTHSVTSEMELHKVVYFSEYIENEGIWNDDFTKNLQTSGDLGIKLSHAINEQCKHHDKVCVIGSDCADLTTKNLEEAFEKLDKTDIVIGPAKDGGYYLIGMNKPHLQLFDNVAWSSDQVLKQTKSTAQQHGLSVDLLPTLSDIDTEKDWLMSDLSSSSSH